MRIALCGSSSTGKTTLVNCLLQDPAIQSLHLKTIDVDARSILRSMGNKNIDMLTPAQSRVFQKRYINEKIKIEENETNYITQRSFVDAAAYWTVRDSANGDPFENKEIIQLCSSCAQRYDLHIFLPFGQIPIEDDGYRSHNIKQYEDVSKAIESYLQKWKINYLRISTGDLQERIREAKNYILSNSIGEG